MPISTKGRYATRMLLDIAQHQKDGYVSMKCIAERQNISKKYLEHFTTHLAKAGLLEIKRGNQGGYRLLAEPKDITLADILNLTEGSLRAVACLEHTPNRCERCSFCMTLPAWEGLDKVVNDYLTSVTLQDLLDQAKPQPSDCAPACGENP